MVQEDTLQRNAANQKKINQLSAADHQTYLCTSGAGFLKIENVGLFFRDAIQKIGLLKPISFIHHEFSFFVLKNCYSLIGGFDCFFSN